MRGKSTSISGIRSPADALRRERAEVVGALLVEDGIDEDGGYEKVERGSEDDSSSCYERSVRLEWEVEESGSTGVDVVRNKLVRECELAVCSFMSV